MSQFGVFMKTGLALGFPAVGETVNENYREGILDGRPVYIYPPKGPIKGVFNRDEVIAMLIQDERQIAVPQAPRIAGR